MADFLPGLVSIMMPAYNAADFIGLAIESLLAQSYPHWQLVVVDDGSNDHTGEIVSRYGDSRIKLLRQENRGEAAARNTALRNNRGEFLAFLDADDQYLPHHLESTVNYLLRRPDVDGVYTDGYYVDQIGNPLQPLSSRRRGPFEGNLFEEVIYGSDVFGPPTCVVLRTRLIDSRGLNFDESIVIGPDWDFFARYAEFAKFGCIDQITCLYRIHEHSVSARTGLKKRAVELSKCRLNAIKTENFGNCSVRVRTAVFYDLLVNLLLDFPEQQSEIIQRSEFIELPNQEQARILRLMASKTMMHGAQQTHIQDWLDRAMQIYPGDWRAAFLWMLFHIHPKLAQILVRMKAAGDVDPRLIPPLWDMKISSGS